MALSASGIGSGLDVSGIVSQLMSLERRPLNQLSSLGTKLDAQLSAYGQLKSALSTFQTAMGGLSTADKFQVYSATSSDTTLFTATADKSAAVGLHSVEVISLAQAHKLSSGAPTAPVFVNSATSIGATGTLEITQDLAGTPRTFQIALDGTNNTLAGIRDAINNATNNTGVVASVVDTGTSSKLVLSAKNTGTANAISIGAGTTASISTALGFETLAGNGAADASIKVDGIAVSSASNTISTAIAGVSLTLKKAGTAQTLDVARDTKAVTASVQTFVDAYNDLRKVIKALGGNEATLSGETVVKGIGRKIENIFNTSASGLALSHTSQVGIKTDPKTGNLSLDTVKLDRALAANYKGVADLFSDSTQGFAVRFEAAAKDMVAFGGLIDSRKEGIETRIRDIDKRSLNLEYRLGLMETKYRTQFAALDGLVSKLQSTGNFLTQQLGKL